MAQHAEHHEGLSQDLPLLLRRGLGRRGLFGLVGGVGAASLVACGAEDRPSTGTPKASTSGPGEIPEETAGPFPADGSNGVNVLTESGVVRQDIRSSFGSASGVAEGVPMTIRLKVYDLDGTSVAPLAGAAVYLWHCDREGRYSMYDGEIAEENYLRGVQQADAEGALEFLSVFPATYPGRWPHLHFEVYPTLDDATAAANKLRTSQIALPEEVCIEVYEGAEGYERSLGHIAQVRLASDMVFADGHKLQMATVEGSLADGYVATLNVPV